MPTVAAKYRDSFISLLLGRLNGQREPFGGRNDFKRAAAFLHHRPAFLRAPVQLVVAPSRFMMIEHERLHARGERQLTTLLKRRMSPSAMVIVLFRGVHR